ncbi:MAG TPA: DUF4136 domain-containing protein [Gammaproteobacteria bacterium]|nr:DUF4136 domain-containing protein [Gammaproteobacteria bacterium]
MKTAFRLMILVAAAALAACATAPEVQYSPQANFASYHSFYWQPVRHGQPVKNPVLDSQILDQRVESAVVATLTSHGYRQVASADQADFIVTYRTASEQQLRSAGGFRFGIGYGYPFGYPVFNPWFGATYYPYAPQVESYQEGDLIIDIIDARTKKLVWRGWTSAVVRPQNFTQQAVNQMVATILSRFPPG